MKYDDALKEWGALRLEGNRKIQVLRQTVKVEMDFDEGFACCGGTDPDCYCSLAESPTANVQITGVDDKGRTITVSISSYEFDFATILREIVEAGGGTVSA